MQWVCESCVLIFHAVEEHVKLYLRWAKWSMLFLLNFCLHLKCYALYIIIFPWSKVPCRFTQGSCLLNWFGSVYLRNVTRQHCGRGDVWLWKSLHVCLSLEVGYWLAHLATFLSFFSLWCKWQTSAVWFLCVSRYWLLINFLNMCWLCFIDSSSLSFLLSYWSHLFQTL